MKIHIAALAVLVCLALAACSSEPPIPPSVQFFKDAKANLKAKDLEAALKNLDRAIKAAGDDPVGQQAMILNVAVLLAHARTTRELSVTFDTGRKQQLAAKNVSQFSRMRSDYNTFAREHLINAVEIVLKQRPKLTNQTLALEADFPDFRGTESPVVTRIKSGIWVTDTERLQCEQDTCCNEMAKILARFVGAGDDVHKGHEQFTKGAVQIDSRVYLLETATAFFKFKDLFGPRDLDQPKYLRIVLEAARDNIDAASKLLAEKPDKALEDQGKKLKADIEKELKKIKE